MCNRVYSQGAEWRVVDGKLGGDIRGRGTRWSDIRWERMEFEESDQIWREVWAKLTRRVLAKTGFYTKVHKRAKERFKSLTKAWASKDSFSSCLLVLLPMFLLYLIHNDVWVLCILCVGTFLSVLCLWNFTLQHFLRACGKSDAPGWSVCAFAATREVLLTWWL